MLCLLPVDYNNIHNQSECSQTYFFNYFKIFILLDVTVSSKEKNSSDTFMLIGISSSNLCSFLIQTSHFLLSSQSNCEMECLSNMTLKYCGCVKFSMPSNINLFFSLKIRNFITIFQEIISQKFVTKTISCVSNGQRRKYWKWNLKVK